MTKVKFFYGHGTAYFLNVLEVGFSVDIGGRVRFGEDKSPSSDRTAVMNGINGKTVLVDGQPQNDPFCELLDPNKWDAVRIRYPASFFPMGASIDYCATQIINGINALPMGQPFALGGYSQGAAAISSVYNEIRYGSLTTRAPYFLGAVCFGNPRRQLNHRGVIGGTWSGAFDIPGSTTGGHGSFPTAGPYARLTGCEGKWVEFTAPDDIFSSVGDSALGLYWTAGNDVLTGLERSQIVTYFTSGMTPDILSAVGTAFAVGGRENTFTDAVGMQFNIGGAGHTTYPFIPPVGLEAGGLTSIQLALTYLEGLADEWARAPIALPPTSAGWSTVLIPPSN